MIVGETVQVTEMWRLLPHAIYLLSIPCGGNPAHLLNGWVGGWMGGDNLL